MAVRGIDQLERRRGREPEIGARHQAPQRIPLAHRQAAPVVTLLALLVYGLQVDRPGPWMDEAATIAASRRSLGELARLVGNVDLGHLAYYLVTRTLWWFEPSVVTLRLFSVVAMALAAGVLVLIGRRLGSLPIGVTAGLLLVVSPQASRYAQEARSVALVVLLASVLTLLLVDLLDPGGRRGRGTPLRYGAVVVAIGLVNVFGLLVLLAHAVTLLLVGTARARRRWTAGTLPALVVLLPWVALVFGQHGQVYWIPPPALSQLRELATDELGGSPLAAAAVVTAVLLLVVAGGRRAPAGPARTAVVLGAALAVLPPLVLFAASFVSPMFQSRYLVWTAPGAYLVIGGLVAGVRLRPAGVRLPDWAAPAAVVLVLGVTGLPHQLGFRDPLTGHADDTAAVADHLAARARPGDAVVLVPNELRIIAQSRPDAFAQLDDVQVLVDPVTAGTFEGTLVTADRVRDGLRPYRRVWLVLGEYQDPSFHTATERETLRALDLDYRAAERTTLADIAVELRER